jgi:hypothetical protein
MSRHAGEGARATHFFSRAQIKAALLRAAPLPICRFISDLLAVFIFRDAAADTILLAIVAALLRLG